MAKAFGGSTGSNIQGEQSALTPIAPSIGSDASAGNPPSQDSGMISRRGFLKILGQGAVIGAASGCANDAKQAIYPNVKGDYDAIPGVATWFRSTCTECSAGCGIEVRVRDGRAVKIEGSKDHPVNRGGLCALGHSALQDHYDPDRVRQPLQKNGSGRFEPISWSNALARISDALKGGSRKNAILTGELSGALDDLFEDFSKAYSADRATYDLLQPVDLAKASELVYGTYGIPNYRFERADMILNFGADFVETWVSPVEFARGWADGRRAKKPARFVHVEPRLSLTGANADLWLSANPGTEIYLVKLLIQAALAVGKGSNLRDDLRSGVAKLVSDVTLDQVVAKTAISKEKILLVQEYLLGAAHPLVIAGGAAASNSSALELQVLVQLLNSLLGVVGDTVTIASMRKPKSSLKDVSKLVKNLENDKVGVLFVYNSNPAFTVPADLGFKFAMRRAQLVVALSSHIDETAESADLILPVNSPLESWGDVRFVPGVNSLLQPTMSPLWDSKHVGDILLTVAEQGGKGTVAKGQKSFEDYLKSSWRDLFKQIAGGGDFDRFWLEALERGGYFQAAGGDTERVKVATSADIFALDFSAAKFAKFEDPVTHNSESEELVVFPFPSVHTFDGRAANRPWMHEVPDPMSQVVWDAWAEIHPDTAVRLGLGKGDLLAIRNLNGELNVPIYLTQHIHPGVVAVPLGAGHTAYGRYATQIGGGNPISLISSKDGQSDAAVHLLSSKVEVRRIPGKPVLVNVQGSDSQHDRELARTKLISAADHGHQEHDEEHHHHEPEQMYEQRKHPLYRWGMAVDLNACTGCSACVVACYAENNIALSGKTAASKGREMSWLRIERYFDEMGHESVQEMHVSFLPMMCQQCGNAPCEPVCPVYATYHNEEGLNAMVYNRCVGTRYCSNNCSYKVRRFNWFEYSLPEPMQLQLNPDVTKRGMGVMEKCTFCVQRINEAKDRAKDQGRMVNDGEVKPACVQSCPTEALVFGNLKDPNSKVSKLAKDKRGYKVLDHHLNTQPAITYLERVKYGD